MSTATTNRHQELIEKLPPASTLILHGISWEEYEELLDALGEANGLRVSYDQGTLQIMTLSTRHEKYVRLIDNMVSLFSIKRRIKVLCYGSATMKKQHKLKGAEPDSCFYVQNAALVGGKSEIDFSIDAPPDVVVEVDLGHDSLSKFPIYAALGVPEIWRYDGEFMTMYHLVQDRYVTAPASQALPALSSDTLTEFLSRSHHEDQYEVLLAFESWLQAPEQ
ncbi:MAG: Uma2 family endonuclease [Acidobacteriota bacterium]